MLITVYNYLKEKLGRVEYFFKPKVEREIKII